MKSLLAILFLSAASVFASTERDDEKSRLAMENPNLFQGDILGFDPYDRNVHPNKRTRWPNGRIPVVIDISLFKHLDLILSAMEHYEKHTCLRFVLRTTEKNYLRLFAGDGCYSHVGMANKGEQPLSLGDGCMIKGTIIHELGHAIGLFHEHMRSDRNKYVYIHYENIKKGDEDQFLRLAPSQNILMTPFDYDSIMMYGNLAFSKDNRSPTIEAKDGRPLLDAFNKLSLSEYDIYEINKMYRCSVINVKPGVKNVKN